MDSYRSETITTSPIPAPTYNDYYQMTYAPVAQAIGSNFNFNQKQPAPQNDNHQHQAQQQQQQQQYASSQQQQLPLGYAMTEESSLVPPETPAPAASTKRSPTTSSTAVPASSPSTARKRARKSVKHSGSSNEGEDGAKKKRGRPRLDSEDNSTTDRRRTQIRLAQRSYRMRKEGTISTLTKRCERLQKTIEDMNNSFLEMTAKFLSNSPANNVLATEVKASTEHFLELAKQSTKELEADDTSKDATERVSDEAIPETIKEEVSPDSQALMQPPQAWSHAVMPTFSAPSAPPPASTQVITTRPSPQPTLALNAPYSFDFQADPSLGFDHMQQHRFNVNLAAQLGSPLDPYLPMPPTYTHLESTFVRRLQRRALEKALYVLSGPNVPNWIVTHVFKLSFCSANRASILARLRYLLATNDRESLDYPQVPYLTLGGAGTHFQDETDTNCQMGQQPYNVRSTGPFALNQHDRVYDNMGGECNAPETMVSLTGFEGEWFDASDVERYLKIKGRNANLIGRYYELTISAPSTPSDGEAIDDTAATATVASSYEANDLESLPQSMTAPSISSGRSQQLGPHTPLGAVGADGAFPFGVSAGAAAMPTTQAPELDFGLPKGGFEVPVTSVGQTSASMVFLANDLAEYQQQQELKMSPPALPPPKPQIRVTIDVEKFVEELTDKAICLGRAPGFRRPSVEESIAASTVTRVDEEEL